LSVDLAGFKTAGSQVVLVGVNDKLLTFTAHLDAIHQLLFGFQLTITSGQDGRHSPLSLHATGQAVDIRTDDKDAQANMMFLMVLAFAAELMPITVFDERNLPGNPHVHIEWHGP
jgi:hypothetical protein